ncbi:hypothetical protein DL769_000154 [Monosporascus sp. CRB-8-3]|nr:hypothetical protein DL769_000154 [Monosporascus sp. CRB-8-3]
MAVELEGYPENLQPWSISVVVAVTLLALLSVALRILARWEKRQRLWWDDYLIIWSMLWALVVAGFAGGMIQYGVGIHIEQVPMGDVVMQAKFLLVAQLLYAFNLVWTKLSILMMYYRIFRFSYFKQAAYAIGAFIISWVICITFLFIFICVPVQKVWAPDMPGRCINQVGTWIANAASTILSDLAILILPMPAIWKLQLRQADKIALSVAFGLGFFVVFASAYRFTVLFLYSALDPSYTLAPTVGWTAIEMSAGIVSACLPTMVPAFKFIGRTIGLGKLVSLSSSKDGSRPTEATMVVTSASAPRSKLHESIGITDSDLYRLSDEARASTDDDHTSFDPKLRPEHNVTHTIASSQGVRTHGRRMSGDEIPLNCIRVKRDIKQERSRGASTLTLNYMPVVQRELIPGGTGSTNHYWTVPQCCPAGALSFAVRPLTTTNITYAIAPGANHDKWVGSGENEDYLPHWIVDTGYNTEYLSKFMNEFDIGYYAQQSKGFTHVDALLDPYQYQYNKVVMSANGDTPVYYRKYHQSDAIRAELLDRLEYLTEQDKPFFLMIAQTAPHDPDETRRHVFRMRRPQDLRMGTSTFRIGIKGGRWPGARLRTLLADEMVQDVVKLFGEKGVLDKTCIIYTTDNGYHLGDHRTFGGKGLLYRGDTSLASYHFAPTFLEISGGTEEGRPSYLDGRSLLSNWHAPERSIESCPYGDAQEIINVEIWGPNQVELPGSRIGPTFRNSYKTLRIVGGETWLPVLEMMRQ